MRLLNTKTLQVEEFVKNIPIYAILSHTWEEDEVSFQDIQDCGNLQDVQDCRNYEEAKQKAQWEKAGWSKIWHACRYVRRYEYEWIWIDTCCIDKSSSAELSEALNSMYQYYKDSGICIAYLSDVSVESDVKDLEGLKKSKWFTRGWTLQELIAPHHMVFLDRDWNTMDTRKSMQHIISEVTSIPLEVLGNGELESYSIAQKMSWAASRETTRDEDMAYCLMGLFGVNMPPIYGEGGAKAFMRLQQEIIKYSDDRSIFAWVTSWDYDRDRGLFASSPSEFAFSGEVGICESEKLGDKSAFSFGNNGLRIHLPLHYEPDIGKDIFFASLHCQTINGFVGVYLQKKEYRYIRWNPRLQLPCINAPLGEPEEIVVKESAIPRQQIRNTDMQRSLSIRFDPHIIVLDEIQNHRSVIRRYPGPYPTHKFRFQTKKAKQFAIDIWVDIVDADDRSNRILAPSRKLRAVLAGVDSESDDMWVESDDVRSVNSDNIVLRAKLSINTHYHPRYSLEKHFLLKDNSLLPLRDDDALKVSLSRGRSSETILDFIYLPTFSAIELSRQINEFRSLLGASSATTLNFRVVDNLNSLFLLQPTHSCFPPTLLWETNREIYGSFSKRGKQCDMHCVFEYVQLPQVVVIALGLCTEVECHEPWVDIFVQNYEHSIYEIWKSYLPSGDRYEHAKIGRTTVQIKLRYGWECRVSVERLESDFYHVVIESERQIP